MSESAHASELAVLTVVECPALRLFWRFVRFLLDHRVFIGAVFAKSTIAVLKPIVADLLSHRFILERENTFRAYRYIRTNLTGLYLMLWIVPNCIIKFNTSQLDRQERLSLCNVRLVRSTLKFIRCEAEWWSVYAKLNICSFTASQSFSLDLFCPGWSKIKLRTCKTAILLRRLILMDVLFVLNSLGNGWIADLFSWLFWSHFWRDFLNSSHFSLSEVLALNLLIRWTDRAERCLGNSLLSIIEWGVLIGGCCKRIDLVVT